jgi:glycosyltransferase involved in cell wall biosynthesis
MGDGIPSFELMANKEKPIVFLTPGASRVGGNIFLVNFLKWFKKNSAIPFLTVYGHSGELEDDIASLGPAFRFDPDSSRGSIFKRGLEIAAREMGIRSKYFQRVWLPKNLGSSDIGLIYSNAVTNHRMLSALPRNGTPVISHCHELESVIYRTGIEGFRATCEMTTRFVAVSHAVKNNLIEKHGIAPEKIAVIHEFIPIDDFSTAETSEMREKARAELNISENAIIVGGSGSLYWRKAPELFVQVADLVRKKDPNAPIFFLWVGGGEKGDFRFFELNYDLEKLGLTDRVHFLEHQPEPTAHFAAIDLFLMISREDPYPLVCLETACLGKPIICFENAGGMPEFVEDDCGFIVPYLDIQTMADRVIELSHKPDLLAKMGAAAAAKVRTRHDILTSAPAMLEIIEEFRLK